MAEYQALILGLEMAMNIKMSRLKVFGDSQLVIRQLLSLYEVKKPEFIPYHKYALKLITSLDCVTLEHVPRKENKQADALANLASTLASCSEEINVPVCQRWVVPPLSHDIEEKEQVGVVSVYEIEREDWRQPLIDYLRHGKLPNDLRHKTEASNSVKLNVSNRNLKRRLLASMSTASCSSTGCSHDFEGNGP
uniref:RNase H type-1 domain-containing protein n=1 Tax=Salix viminalis TaxID=40686 RepID=A0A6N2N2Z4_SALVM